MNKTWDPLISSKQADSEIVSAAQKREIKNILKLTLARDLGLYEN